jgi:hypothetical protein
MSRSSGRENSVALALSPALGRPQPLTHFQLVERLGGEEQTFQLPLLQGSQGFRPLYLAHRRMGQGGSPTCCAVIVSAWSRGTAIRGEMTSVGPRSTMAALS